MITKIQSADLSFQGLYQRFNPVNKTIGHANINKCTFMLNKFVYHPFENESAEFIKKQVKEHTFGRAFTLWEKDHGQQEGDYYSMNFVSEGNKISEENKNKYIAEGYSEELIGGVLDYDSFIETYNNECYGTMDVSDLDSADVIRIVQRERLVD